MKMRHSKGSFAQFSKVMGPSFNMFKRDQCTFQGTSSHFSTLPWRAFFGCRHEKVMSINYPGDAEKSCAVSDKVPCVVKHSGRRRVRQTETE